MDTNLFYLKQVRIVGFLAFGTGLYQAAFVFVPAMTVKLFGVEPSTASFMLLPVVFTMAISSPVSGRLIDKYGSRIIINIAFILMAIGLSLLFAVNLTKYIFYFAGVMLGMGLSVLAGSSLRYIMLNEVSAGERASAQGVLTIMISLGQIIASALIGAFTTGYQNGIKGYQIVFALLTFITVFLGISSLRLKSRKQEKESYSGK
ncbi:MAG: MFS transporter [Saprospiraceae bacterium]|nr:MFS transporter [Saprospiraceae bacterium]